MNAQCVREFYVNLGYLRCLVSLPLRSTSLLALALRWQLLQLLVTAAYFVKPHAAYFVKPHPAYLQLNPGMERRFPQEVFPGSNGLLDRPGKCACVITIRISSS